MTEEAEKTPSERERRDRADSIIGALLANMSSHGARRDEEEEPEGDVPPESQEGSNPDQENDRADSPAVPADERSGSERGKKGGLFRLVGRLKRGRKKPQINFHSLDSYEGTLAELRFEDHKYDSLLKKRLGNGILILLFFQVFAMNVGFIGYAVVEVFYRERSLPEAMIIAWLTTSIVQVVGLATVVAKYLFPGAGSNWTHEPNQNGDG